MAISTEGTPKSSPGTATKPTAPAARPGYSESEGASRIAALLSGKPEKKPAARDAQSEAKPRQPAPVADETPDTDGADEFTAGDEDEDEIEAGAEEPNEATDGDDSEDSDEDRGAVEGDEDDGDDTDQARLLGARIKHPKLGDEPLTVQELVNGYLRQQDYTRKTQEAAKLRKGADAETSEVRKEREQNAALLKQLQAALQEATPQEPNWDEEFQNNPDTAPALYAQWDLHKKRLATIAEESAKADEKVRKDREAEFEAHMKREGEALVEAMGWKGDKAKMNAGLKAIWDYGISLGFGEQQLANVNDHRLQVVLDKARRWDAAQAKAKASRAGEDPAKPKSVRPGQSTQQGKPRDRKREAFNSAKKRLAQTGSTRDAAAAIRHLM